MHCNLPSVSQPNLHFEQMRRKDGVWIFKLQSHGAKRDPGSWSLLKVSMENRKDDFWSSHY